MSAPPPVPPVPPVPAAGRRPLLASVLRTGWVYASAGFGYAALSAIFRPRHLSEHVWHSLPWLRKDTFGIACFAASALAYLGLGLVRRPGQAARAVLAATALYGFTGWVYIACNALRHPATLTMPLTHLAPLPREGDFGAACFAVSCGAYLLLQLWKSRDAHQ
jgi:hypothetical protein